MIKKLWFYLTLIVIPLLALFLLGIKGVITEEAEAIGIIIYAFIYHPLISGIRLEALGKINKNQLFLNLIPFWNWKYYSSLFGIR